MAQADRRLWLGVTVKYGTGDRFRRQSAAINHNQLIPALIEANRRKDEQIHALSKRISALEEKASKKAGRKRQTFYLDGKELTDEDIVYYVRYDYYTIPELERLVGAKKNQLRNRYNRIIKNSV